MEEGGDFHTQGWEVLFEPRRGFTQVSAPVPPPELLEPSANESGVKKRKEGPLGADPALSPSPLPHCGRSTFWKAGR